MSGFLEERFTVLESANGQFDSHLKHLHQAAKALVDALRNRWMVQPDVVRIGRVVGGAFEASELPPPDDDQQIEFAIQVKLEAPGRRGWGFWVPIQMRRSFQGTVAAVANGSGNLVLAPSGGAYWFDVTMSDIEAWLTSATEAELQKQRLKD